MFHKMYHAYHRAVNKVLEEMERMLNFQYMSCSRSITFTYTKNAEDFISEEFSNNLAIMLNFEANRHYVQWRKKTKSEKLLHLSAAAFQWISVGLFRLIRTCHCGRHQNSAAVHHQQEKRCETGIQQCGACDVQSCMVCATAERVLRHHHNSVDDQLWRIDAVCSGQISGSPPEIPRMTHSYLLL